MRRLSDSTLDCAGVDSKHKVLAFIALHATTVRNRISMGAQRDLSPQIVPITCAADLKQFVSRLGFRENFELILADTFPQPGWKGEGNIVWHEGRIAPGQDTFYFFYDDGVLPEFEANGDPVGDTDDYPCITCRLADIVGVRRSSI